MTHGTVELDSRLHKWFEELRPTPPRDPQRAVQGREGFLQQARSLGRPVSPAPARRLIGWRGLLRLLTRHENWPMTKVAALLMSIVLFLGGGAGLTAYASQDALPGDALYGIKSGLEQTQLALSSTAAGDFELHMQFAAERLSEITTLVAEGRYEDAHTAVDALAYQLSQAGEALKVVAEEDPVLAAELAGRYVSFITESRNAITVLMRSAPMHAQEVLGDALGVLEAAFGTLAKYYTGGYDLVDGGGKPVDEADTRGVFGVDKPEDSAAKPADDVAEPDHDAAEPDNNAEQPEDVAEPHDDADEPDDDDVDEPDDDDADEPDDDDSDDGTGSEDPDDDDETEDDEEPDDTEEPDDDAEEPDDEEAEGSDD